MEAYAAPLPRRGSGYIAFDLEIAKIIPGDFSAWHSHRPLGITCAATLIPGEEPVLWYGQEEGGYAACMPQVEAARLVNYLHSAAEQGWKILTWNGLGFDFDVLAEESGCLDLCRHLALHHYDMMFHVLCLKGFPLALETAARGMGLPGKTAGMSGDQAPILWKQGRQAKVLEYVSQDVRTTLEVALAVEHAGCLRWTSKSGRPASLALPDGLLPAHQAACLPEPDTSWMSAPIKRRSVMQWMGEE
jgi:hypothetical protein